jgi:hypothetical protein
MFGIIPASAISGVCSRGVTVGPYIVIYVLAVIFHPDIESKAEDPGSIFVFDPVAGVAGCVGHGFALA